MSKAATPVTKNSVLKRDYARFKKMPKPRRRVEVAKDVIHLLKIGSIDTRTGGYARLNWRSAKSLNFSSEEHIRPLTVKSVVRNSHKCHVCALGGVFLSYLLNVNGEEEAGLRVEEGGRLKWEDPKSHEQLPMTHQTIAEALGTLFEPQQLQLIESAFEGWHRTSDDVDTRDSLVKWNRELCILSDNWAWSSDEAPPGHLAWRDARLYAVMENIIRNKGTFDINDKPRLPTSQKRKDLCP